MATTTLLPRHANDGETIAEAIRDCLDYGKNPEKTEKGKYISSYAAFHLFSIGRTKMENYGFQSKDIKRVVHELHWVFGMKSIEEADRHYCQSPC